MLFFELGPSQCLLFLEKALKVKTCHDTRITCCDAGRTWKTLPTPSTTEMQKKGGSVRSGIVFGGYICTREGFFID